MKKYKKRKKIFLDKIVKKKLNVKPASTAVFGGWIEDKSKPDGYDLYNYNMDLS